MREQGLSEEALFNFFREKKAEDLSHSRILSSMCTPPHPVAIKAHELFIETNLGDPGLFPGTASLEQLLIKRIGTLFHLPEAVGYATSGGTESNIQALRIARYQSQSKKPNVVLPESVHFSFCKACDMLNIEMRPVPLDDNYTMDVTSAESLVNKDTCCLVAVAGTTEYGKVDPVPALSDIAIERNIFFHVDAAFGGFVLPFMEKSPSFDFKCEGVSSIAVDPHKMGMSTIPTGCILVRDESVWNCLKVDTPYLSVKQEVTLSGTRPGGSVVGALAVLEYLGTRGMRAIVEGCMKNTQRLIRGMETFGINRAVTPDVNVATFQNIEHIPDGWAVSWTRKGHLRIVCMPHVESCMIEKFLEGIGEIYA